MKVFAWVDDLAEKFILLAEGLIWVSIVLVVMRFSGVGWCA